MTSTADTDPDVRAFDLFKELVAITTERWISPGRFGALALNWAPSDISAQVRFLTRVKNVLRAMPVQVFSDADARQAALAALQDALDTAIEQEEQQAPPGHP